MHINVNSNNEDSSKRYNKFWKQSISEDTTPEDSTSGNSNDGNTGLVTERRDDRYDVEISANTTTGTNANNYEYTLRNTSDNSLQTSANSRDDHQQVRVFNAFEETSSSTSTKRYQTKMLLASLIEHFCETYGDTPNSNRKVFYLICRTLRSLGIIDAEFVDEMTSVRSSFQHAFQKLFYTAVQTVRNQDLIHFDDNLPRLLIRSTPLESKKDHTSREGSEQSSTKVSSSCSAAINEAFDTTDNSERQVVEDYFSSHTSQMAASSISNKLSSSASSANTTLHCMVNGRDNDFFHNLSVQNSRYKNDFIEMNLLGKGGFASAFRARNRLDGIDYAVKKIRLGNNIEETDRYNEKNPYEKIFREIKNLARLEHHNVIRYYSSWLELDDSTGDQELESDRSDWEESVSRPLDQSNRKSIVTIDNDDNDTGSIFQGRDPTFSDPSMSSLGSGRYMYNDESGMSQIQFGECSSSGYEGGSAGGDVTSYGSWSTPVKSKSASYSNKKTNKTKSGWTLFIQMQLCPTTLHDYIRFRNKQYSKESSCDIIDAQRNIEIFSQILEGTAYIHDQGLIHRDLKPSNIFLSMPTYIHDSDGKRRSTNGSSRRGRNSCDSSSLGSDRSSPRPGSCSDYMWEESWVPKIGDFGLAAEAMDEGTGDTVLVPTPISSTPPSPKIGPSSNNSASSNLVGQVVKNDRPARPKPKRTRTLCVGTRTYASPEQLAIPAQAYDKKVDIYSLGIILFELFQPFSTGMERADSIDKLKSGVFPEGFLESYPKVTALIIWMMDENPNHRPEANQLLEFELFSHPSAQENQDICSTLQTKLQSKINQLERKNIEIEELKKTVARVELEKQQALEVMQTKLEEMQSKLDRLSLSQGPVVETMSNGTSVKNCILSPTPSFLKKKRGVRWSTLNSATNT